MVSVVVAIFTAPINLLIDYLFVDILSAPTEDSLKSKPKVTLQPNRLQKIVKKAGETGRRASAMTMDAIKIARKQVLLGSHQSMQIPELTLEAHVQAKLSSHELVQDHKAKLERKSSSREVNRSQILVERQQRSLSRQNHPHKNHDEKKNSSSSHSRRTAEVDDITRLFSEFVVDLSEQRRVLKPSSRDNYDSQWG